MSAITFGPPVLPQTPPPALVQPPLQQAPTAVAALERQANGAGAKPDLGRRDAGGSPPSGGRGKLVDFKA